MSYPTISEVAICYSCETRIIDAVKYIDHNSYCSECFEDTIEDAGCTECTHESSHERDSPMQCITCDNHSNH